MINWSDLNHHLRQFGNLLVTLTKQDEWDHEYFPERGSRPIFELGSVLE